MISAQVIKTSIEELQAITRVDLCVLDLSGSVVATTKEGENIDASLIINFANSPVDSQVIGNDHLLKILDEGDLAYILVASGDGESTYTVGKICVSQLQNLIVAYKERYDRNNFFQNLMLDNLLLIDIYNRAKKLHIDVNVPRVIILIETGTEKDTTVSELLSGMYTSQSGDYITAVDETSVILQLSVSSLSRY